MLCNNCGKKLEDDSTYCGSCGTKFELSSNNTRILSHEGDNIKESIEEDTKFCGKCGFTLEENSCFCGSCGDLVHQYDYKSNPSNDTIVSTYDESNYFNSKKNNRNIEKSNYSRGKDDSKGDSLKPLIAILLSVVVISFGVVYYFLFVKEMSFDVEPSSPKVSKEIEVKSVKKNSSQTKEIVQNDSENKSQSDEKESSTKDSNSEEENDEEVKETTKDTAKKYLQSSKDSIKKILDVQKIKDIISSDENNATVSLYIKDLKNKTSYEVNGSKKLSASALVNIPILYAISREYESNDNFMEESIPFSYTSTGRGKIKQEQNGEYFSINDLLHQVLSYSDNNATNSILEYLSFDKIIEICHNYGYKSVDVQRFLGKQVEDKDNYINAKDSVNMLADMYEDKTKLGKDFITNNFKILDSTTNTGMAKSIPNDVLFLNHNALTSEIYNEIAIIKSDNAEFIISILTNNGKSETSTKTVEKLSSYIYGKLN